MNRILEKDIQGFKVKEMGQVALGAYIGYKTLSYAWWKYKNSQTRAKGRKARAAKDAKTFNFRKVEKEEWIQNLTVTELKDNLIKGTFTSVDLVHVFGKRCYTVGRELFLSAEENFEEALEVAAQKDLERVDAIKNGTTDSLPYLHGIPVSLKDTFEQKGMMSTNGCDHRCDIVYNEDCVAVKLFREAGAILLVRGNTPQLTYQLHSENKVWGISQNPFNKGRTCGGSTGGDGGLVSSRCVPLSFGADLAGSVRIPSHFNGIRGFKLTPHRTTLLGNRSPLPDNFFPSYQVRATIGPMANSTDDIILGLKTLLHPHINRLDPFAPPCPFRDDLYQHALNGKVRVGYFTSLDYCPATPSMQRAVIIAKNALEQQGFTLVPITFTEKELTDARDITFGIIANLMVGPLIKIMDENYDEPLGCYKFSMWYISTNCCMRNLTRNFFRLAAGKRIYNILKSSQPLSKAQYDALQKRHTGLTLEIQEKWEKLGIQALIQPSYPTCAFKAEHNQDSGALYDYMNLWSALGYPAGVVPVGEVEPNEETGYADTHNDLFTKAIIDDMKGSSGMPISVTVVSQLFEDEIAVGVMQAIDRKVNFRKIPTL